jgi:hypothetical protein
MSSSPDPIPGRIFEIRDHRVILDSDLARLYGVPTKVSTKPSSATLTVSLRILPFR